MYSRKSKDIKVTSIWTIILFESFWFSNITSYQNNTPTVIAEQLGIPWRHISPTSILLKVSLHSILYYAYLFVLTNQFSPWVFQEISPAMASPHSQDYLCFHNPPIQAKTETDLDPMWIHSQGKNPHV